MLEEKRAIVLVAHGSKRKESNEEFVQLCKNIQKDNALEYDSIQHAFLEFENPTLEVAVGQMYAKHINKVYIYPYFLNSGKHVHVDIPLIISQAELLYPNMKIEILPHFGSSKSIVSLISSDLLELV